MKLLILAALVSVCAADKIVGGDEAAKDQFPFIVHLDSKTVQAFCDGSIIDEYWIISAAHCYQSGNSNKAVAGDFYLQADDSSTDGSQNRLIEKFIKHGAYNSRTLENDIMLIRLVEPFTMGAFISPIALPTETPPAGTETDISGWGNTLSSGTNYPDELRFVTLPVLSRITCNKPSSYNGEVLESMLCIGDMSGGQDSCQGDSGGPVTLMNSNVLVGIVSWGYGCAQPNYPGIYTDVYHYVESGWITTTMNNN
ncbi:trypsin I-P1-like [Styela clava]|uniref:trypsin I-P1-like n=1 Tax=Styela clava TaxID=7725 RepID=UPI0019398FFD|nr:trypsin I-P1-like [Styela clava]